MLPPGESRPRRTDRLGHAGVLSGWVLPHHHPVGVYLLGHQLGQMLAQVGAHFSDGEPDRSLMMSW